MDILTHTLSGLAAGTVVAGFSDKNVWDKAKMVAVAGLAGAVPDIDAISLWSKFDSTIGRFFHLPDVGKDIYSGKWWYSHHGFFHSLFAAVLFVGLIGIFSYWISLSKRGVKRKTLPECFRSDRWMMLAFVAGYLMHLLGDLPTPASSWGGVRLFWPSEVYVGGSGHVWWWNNYDLFLITLGVLVVNMFILLTKRKVGRKVGNVVLTVFVCGFLLSLLQINTRPYDFAYSGHTGKYQEYETQSKEIQKEILGERVFRWMEAFDRKLKVYF